MLINQLVFYIIFDVFLVFGILVMVIIPSQQFLLRSDAKKYALIFILWTKNLN